MENKSDHPTAPPELEVIEPCVCGCKGENHFWNPRGGLGYCLQDRNCDCRQYRPASSESVKDSGKPVTAGPEKGTDATCEMDTSVPSLSSEAKACEQNLEMDAGAGKSDYTYSLTFTSSKFIVTAFGHDRDHCEDVLQCVLLGKFKDHEGDREFERVA
jgi:hypothetical protein